MQAAGINGFLYYGPQVLKQAGVGALLANLGFNPTSTSLLVNVFITFSMLPCIALSMRLMDIAGRRYIYMCLYSLINNNLVLKDNIFLNFFLERDASAIDLVLLLQKISTKI